MLRHILLQVIRYHNVTAAIFTEMRHEILKEVDKIKVWEDVLEFVRAGVRSR